MQESREKSRDSKSPIDDLISQRKQKMKELREKGVEVYPHKFDATHSIGDIVKKGRELEGKTISAHGRIMSMRKMGKASFIHIRDMTGKVQAYLKSDDIGSENYMIFKLLDIGDFVGLSGKMFYTKTGEFTIHVGTLAPVARATSRSSLVGLPKPFVERTPIALTFDACSALIA